MRKRPDTWRQVQLRRRGGERCSEFIHTLLRGLHYPPVVQPGVKFRGAITFFSTWVTVQTFFPSIKRNDRLKSVLLLFFFASPHVLLFLYCDSYERLKPCSVTNKRRGNQEGANTFVQLQKKKKKDKYAFDGGLKEELYTQHTPINKSHGPKA